MFYVGVQQLMIIQLKETLPFNFTLCTSGCGFTPETDYSTLLPFVLCPIHCCHFLQKYLLK